MRKYSWMIALFAIFAVVFTGFVSCKDGGGGKDPGNGNTETVIITFNINSDGAEWGGDHASVVLSTVNVTINKGAAVTPPVAVLADHDLTEWNTADDGTGHKLLASTTHEENTTYYAIWDQNLFDITETWDFSEILPTTAADDNNANVWDLDGDIITALRAAKVGSVLRLYFDATGTTNGTNRNNWAIGSIGVGNTALDVIVIGLWSPQTAGLVYDIDVELDWCLDLLGAEGNKLHVFVPRNNGDKLVKVELMEPMEGRVPPVRPTAPPFPPNNIRGLDADGNADGFIAVLPITFGYFGDVAAGKGEIAGAQIELIREEIEKIPEDSLSSVVLRIWTRNTLGNDRSSWADCGQINSVPGLIGGANGLGGLLDPVNNRASNIPHTGANGIIALLGTRNRLDLNPYNGQIITLVELWVITPPSMDITLSGDDDITQNVLIHARGGNVKSIEGGFEFDRTANHRAGYSWFAVDFPGAKRLTHYSEIKFNYQLMSDQTDDRRIALIASNTALGSANFTAHSSGGSGQAFPNGSDHGFLAAGQVSRPILNEDQTESLTIEDPNTKQEIVLKIDPLEATHYHNQRVYFSIYDHVFASVIQITDIIFVEAEGCTLCEDVCECNTIISEAKTIVEGLSFTDGKVNNSSTEANAIAYVLSIIEDELPAGVTAEIETVSFAPWTEAGDGSFVFKVILNRGAGAEQVTTDLTLVIEEFEAAVVWNMDNDYLARTNITWPTFTAGGAWGSNSNTTNSNLAPYSGWTGISSSASTFGPLHTSSGTANTHLLVIDRTNTADPAIISINSTDNQQFNLIIGTAQNGLGLKTAEFIYEITVSGTVIDGGTNARLQLSYNGAFGAPSGDFFPLTNFATVENGGSFEIKMNLPRTTDNPSAAADVIRFQPRPSSGSQTIRIDTIEIKMVGIQPPVAP